MSLKAKLEAVIYAAEEPVTLSQLAALFGADALELKAEEEAAAAAAQESEPAQPTETQTMLDEGLAYLNLGAAESVPEPAAEPTSDGTESAPEAEAAPAENTLDAEAEAKRQARLRDREVKAILRKLLDELIADYAADGRGIEIREIAGGYRMATKPECHDAVRIVHQEPQAGAQAVAACARNPRRHRLQAARHRA